MVGTVTAGSGIACEQNSEDCKALGIEVGIEHQMGMVGTDVDILTSRDLYFQTNFFPASEGSVDLDWSRTAPPVSAHAQMVLLPDICFHCGPEMPRHPHCQNSIVCVGQMGYSGPALLPVHTELEAHAHIVAGRWSGKTCSRLEDSAQVDINERTRDDFS